MRKTDACQLAALVLTGGLFATTLFCGAAQASAVGSLKQLAAPSGCITDSSSPTTGCGVGRALLGVAPFFGSHAVAVSRDGTSLYAVAFTSDAIVAFDRNPDTGTLKQISGQAARGMIKPTSVAISPDGKSVYVASIVGSSIATFDRNRSTGKLKQKANTEGCLSANPGNDCASGRAMKGVDVVAVSPGGGNVYAGSFESDSVVILDRSASSGAITQKAGTAGCITEAATDGCRTGRALDGAEGLTVSPDGKSVYVGAAIGNGVAVFKRDHSKGGLTQASDTTGCSAFQAAEGCANGDGLVGADSMQVSPDNKNLYVASGVGSSIAAFTRNPKTGNLTQLAGTAGCFVDRKHSLGRCDSGVEIDGPEGIAVSPDGETVYVGSYFSSSVTVFDRVTYTGTITQRAGAHGCFTNVATSGCTTAKALGSANALSVSPDGRNLYVGSFTSNGLAIFNRAQPRSGFVTTSVPARLAAPAGGVVQIPVRCDGTSGMRCPGGISVGLASNSQDGMRGGSFNIPVGKQSSVSVVIPRSVHHNLSQMGLVKVTVTMRVVEPSGQIVIFRDSMLLVRSELG